MNKPNDEPSVQTPSTELVSHASTTEPPSEQSEIAELSINFSALYEAVTQANRYAEVPTGGESAAEKVVW